MLPSSSRVTFTAVELIVCPSPSIGLAERATDPAHLEGFTKACTRKHTTRHHAVRGRGFPICGKRLSRPTAAATKCSLTRRSVSTPAANRIVRERSIQPVAVDLLEASLDNCVPCPRRRVGERSGIFARQSIRRQLGFVSPRRRCREISLYARQYGVICHY